MAAEILLITSIDNPVTQVSLQKSASYTSDGGCRRRGRALGVPFHVPSPSLLLIVASQIGLGAHLQDLIAAGMWTSQRENYQSVS